MSPVARLRGRPEFTEASDSSFFASLISHEGQRGVPPDDICGFRGMLSTDSDPSRPTYPNRWSDAPGSEAPAIGARRAGS